MEKRFDIGQFVNTLTEQFVVNGIVERAKKKRKQIKLSQKQLSQKSGVTYASIRRFETTGGDFAYFTVKNSACARRIERF